MQTSIAQQRAGSACARGSALRCAVPARLIQLRNNRRRVAAQAAASDDQPNPVRAALTSLVSGIYKIQASTAGPEPPGTSTLWKSVKRLDTQGVSEAAAAGVDLNERDANGDTPLLYIARAGHYKYPPAEIPAALIKGGADINAKDSKGMTALQVSLLSGWQNIAELLIKNNASTAGVAEIKSRLTCPDCKRVVAKYNL